MRDTKKAKFIRVVITKEFTSNFVDKGTFSAVSNKWKIENGNFMMSHDVIVPLTNHKRLKLLSEDDQSYLIKWTPHSEDVCPSSVAKYLADSGLDIEEECPEEVLKQHCHPDVIPDFNNAMSFSEFRDVEDWMGSCYLGINETPDSKIDVLAQEFHHVFFDVCLLSRFSKAVDTSKGWIGLSFSYDEDLTTTKRLTIMFFKENKYLIALT